MLNLSGTAIRTCDGISRRGFLSIGSLLAGGLSLPHLLRHESEVRAAGGSPRRKAVIQVWLAGGPSHIDMYDLKPQAPAEFRGEFKPVATSVSGVEISEHLPMQARLMDRLAIVRSAFHTNAGHGMGSQWMLTGYQPTIEVNNNIYPATGSIVARVQGAAQSGMPAYVNLPYALGLGKAAYLGAEYNPFAPESDPNSDGFNVRNLKLPGRIDTSRMSKRHSLLSKLDTIRRDVDTKGDIQGLDQFYSDAVEMITSDRARTAFDVHAEDPKLREKYGRNDLGQS